VTRYVVTLEGGGTLIAVSQNSETAAADVLQARGQQVRVSWRDDQTFAVGEGAADATGGQAPNDAGAGTGNEAGAGAPSEAENTTTAG
jgi:hypothetical protein